MLLNLLCIKPKDNKNFRRLLYTRYANTIILGFMGTKEEALTIQFEIKRFVEQQLKLEINTDKTNIYNSKDNNIMYLGFFLRYSHNNNIFKNSKILLYQKKQNTQLIYMTTNSAQLRAPVFHLIQYAIRKGYAKVRENGTVRATSCQRISSLEDKQIVQIFSTIIKEIVEYYSPTNHYSRL